MRWAMGTFKDRNRTIYTLLVIGVLLWPSIADVTTGGSGNHLVSTAADAGIYVLLAIGLNVVVGFAGLLDLGYAAFFAIGAYTYAMLASSRLGATPLHHEVHIPFWLLLLVAVGVAASFGLLLGAPTLRLRGDYLAIVTLGFAGCFYGAKLSLVSPENFSFVVSVTILLMVVLGGMGNVPGVMVGALAIYLVDFYFLTNLPAWSSSLASGVGLGTLNQTHGGW